MKATSRYHIGCVSMGTKQKTIGGIQGAGLNDGLNPFETWTSSTQRGEYASVWNFKFVGNCPLQQDLMVNFTMGLMKLRASKTGVWNTQTKTVLL